jgi:hypothetical protein
MRQRDNHRQPVERMLFHVFHKTNGKDRRVFGKIRQKLLAVSVRIILKEIKQVSNSLEIIKHITAKSLEGAFIDSFFVKQTNGDGMATPGFIV